MGKFIWTDLTREGIVAEYRTDGGVQVVFHNRDFQNIPPEVAKRRAQEAMRVAQGIVDRCCLEALETTGTRFLPPRIGEKPHDGA